MSTSQIIDSISHWVPKEASAAAAGIGIAATSNTAIQFLASVPRLHSIVGHLVGYSCGAAAIAGTVMTVYSAVRLSQKVVTEKPVLQRVVTATTVGCFATALAQTIGQYFWTIAPSLGRLNGLSLAYCIGTNFAWQVSAVTGIAGIVFTAYAAYRTGQALVATINLVENPS